MLFLYPNYLLSVYDVLDFHLSFYMLLKTSRWDCIGVEAK